MKFIIEIWNINKLLDLAESGNLDLNPPYQRNPIWTKPTQKHLIQSIKDGAPIPNLFLFKKTKDKYEMVDGQQRTRALKIFKNSDEIKLTKDDTEFKNGAFLKYEIPITIITEVGVGEYIEEFYYLVNSSGIKLNRPESFKAHYFKTVFLSLVEKLTTSTNFQELDIIPTSSQKRMMDRELVEELCALVIHGITDKKNQVDKIYENDISEKESQMCEEKFNEVLSHIQRFNLIFQVKGTRYRQRNDFYTIFGFIKDNLNTDNQVLDYFYRILIVLEKGIRPSKEACKPLSEYALNCVSQSNSARARQVRLEIISNILLNESLSPNATQSEIMDFYSLDQDSMIVMGKNYVFDVKSLSKAIETYHSTN